MVTEKDGWQGKWGGVEDRLQCSSMIELFVLLQSSHILQPKCSWLGGGGGGDGRKASGGWRPDHNVV